jgi:hypothetical protein
MSSSSTSSSCLNNLNILTEMSVGQAFYTFYLKIAKSHFQMESSK